VLYVQGIRRSLAARDRTAGMEEAAKGADLDVVPLEGGWSADEAREAVPLWLGIAVSGGGRVDLVGCQNDQIALGTLEALGELARELGRPELVHVPVTGCDGTRQLGQRLVQEGRLRATVALARSSGQAVELLARAVTGGTPPPPLTLLKSLVFPAEAALVALPPARA
jgi:ABC-type sugar transport system substrate-binding protein